MSEEKDEAQACGARSFWLGIVLAVACGFTGIALRYLARNHANGDATQYLIPWYTFARDHGVGGLGEAFTNYAPFYSYLLLIAARFDWLGQPLSIVKAISGIFEFGCAIVVTQIVFQATRSPLRALLAFCAVWLAPTAVLNGSWWGQADSIWTFFTLISIALFMQERNGVLPFAMAFSVKAQALFLGPFVLGMILRRKVHWAWLAAIPVVYVAFAVPALLEGRTISSVFGVYSGQAGFYHHLSMYAANIWFFARGVPYGIGVAIGLMLAAAGGFALSTFLMRSKRTGPEFTLLIACTSLLLMPYLLPKMHDRYFYAFELASIALAFLNFRYLPVAVIAQVDGVLSYLAFDSQIVMGLPVAALCNAFLVFYLVLDLSPCERGFRFPRLAWLGFSASMVGLFSVLMVSARGWHFSPTYLITAALASAMTLLLLKESRYA